MLVNIWLPLLDAEEIVLQFLYFPQKIIYLCLEKMHYSVCLFVPLANRNSSTYLKTFRALQDVSYSGFFPVLFGNARECGRSGCVYWL